METAMERLDRLIFLGWGDYPQNRIPAEVVSGAVEDYAPEVKRRARRPRLGATHSAWLDEHAAAMRARPEALVLMRRRLASIESHMRRRASR